MNDEDRARVVADDLAHSWHPFTQMREWVDPLVIERGEGASLFDAEGRRYLDGNSSIWTNVHGHGHPAIVEAIQRQAAELAHSSFLGFTHRPGAELGRRLCELSGLDRAFLTDDGSTAIECAIKMALQYRQLVGDRERCEFVAFDQAYHGDTLGAAALGGIKTFHGRFAGMGFTVHHVADMAELRDLGEDLVSRIAGVCIEPLIQGAAGMKTWPAGMLADLRAWCDEVGAFLILDEVMTGFGRTGKMFACEHEGVVPDFLCLAKGLTGGTLPLAATLTTERVYEAFLGDYAELKTFFYGHSYTGNPMGCAAALANLDVFENEQVLVGLPSKVEALAEALAAWKGRSNHVGAVRQCGMIAGIDVVRDQASGDVFSWEEQTGARICVAARQYGLLTRPVGDTLVLMPPLCVSEEEIREAVAALEAATKDGCG